MAAQFAEQTIERPPRARLAPLGPVEIEDRDPDPIQIDAGVVPRFRDRVLHEHRRDDEEPGGDRDLPPQQGALAPAARRPGGRPGGERAAHVDRARHLDRRLEAEDDQRHEE